MSSAPLAAKLRGLPAVVTALCVAGCATKLPTNAPLREHVIEMDEEGNAIDPAHHPRLLSQKSYDDQINEMFDAMRDYHGAHGGPKKILIFVHGGMNEQKDVLDRAAKQWHDIECAGYYPVFIAWNSELVSSYGEHLLHVRQGRNVGAAGLWTSPLYLLADLGRAVFRAPVVWINQVAHDASRASADLSAFTHDDPVRRWVDNPEEAKTVLVTDALLKKYRKDPNHEIALSMGEVQRGNDWGRALGYVLTVPLKFGESWLIDAAGKAAWDNMSRRTLMLFEGPTATDLKSATTRATRNVLAHSTGALQHFLERLRSHLKGHGDYAVSLVGHSMGTMVLDEFVRRSPDVNYRNIVYMAAACTVRDFQRSIIPYLEDHHDCHFYNLCLHPINDLREANPQGLDLVPRGSLLVWIDDFLADPNTPLDRTMGRWDNIVEAAWVIPRRDPANPHTDIRKQISLKAFALNVRDDYDWNTHVPQKHTHFSWYYWDEDFWKPSPPEKRTNSIDAVHRKAAQMRA